jgi:Uma2 family endonuclease
MSAQPSPRMTVEQYLKLDRESEFRSEYFGGYVTAMAGASVTHARIAGNLFGLLWNDVNARGCLVAANDLRLRLNAQGYTYPDIMVICGEPALSGDRQDTVTNPSLIVEVLSDSTEAHDRGFKFYEYWKLPSLREYVLVSQNNARVEVFRRGAEGEWVLTAIEGLSGKVRFESVGCELATSDIYSRVTFPEQT